MKRFNLLWCVALALVALVGCGPKETPAEESKFITVEDGQFMRDGEPYYFVGTNFWYGAILGSEGEGGNRERLCKELDFMKANGIDNLRILVGGEGENGLLGKIEPNLQPEPGVYNDEVLAGLDYLMMELGKRDMTAVLYFNNAWEWSGGYTQYVAWANNEPVLVPRVDGWFSYNEFAGEFVRNERAKQMFYDHLRYIITRTNRYTGVKYIDDPAIFSWQISNEPRAFSSKTQDNKEAFAEWLAESARLIRELDPNHMISTGSEGFYGCEWDMELCERIHAIEEISYINCHVWPYNWKWLRGDHMTEDLEQSCENTKEYIDMHIELAEKINKPLVVEEFGMPRDNMDFRKQSGVECRDEYFRFVFALIEEAYNEGGKFAGCNFWSWGGYAVTHVEDHEYWAKGDDYTGDPAQEQQGLNSIFVEDASTLEIIRETNRAIGNLR
ncbi:MAG: cellulase family glycosylhydrolase [Alistipes sp.]|nr:cellulase family glycosylhydrolase [Alistipes sp.]